MNIVRIEKIKANQWEPSDAGNYEILEHLKIIAQVDLETDHQELVNANEGDDRRKSLGFTFDTFHKKDEEGSYQWHGCEHWSHDWERYLVDASCLFIVWSVSCLWTFQHTKSILNKIRFRTRIAIGSFHGTALQAVLLALNTN